MEEFEFNYDVDNDDLFLFDKKGHSKGSVEFGDLIFDFDKTSKIVGIEIMNATKFLKKLSKETDTEEMLLTLKKCIVEQSLNNNYIIFIIYFFSKGVEVKVPMTIPCVEHSSPALVYA
ncbi:MAG: DUF2283 domain-containing protein [Candidatus Hydrothermarchaeales archaeon]